MRALSGSSEEQAAAQGAELRALGAAMSGIEQRLAGCITELGADVRRGLQLLRAEFQAAHQQMGRASAQGSGFGCDGQG